MHAQAFETMAHGQFLVPAGNSTWLTVCVSLAVAAGLIFWLLPGWSAYLLIIPLLATVHYFLPVQFFARGIVLPYVAPVAVAFAASEIVPSLVAWALTIVPFAFWLIPP